MRNILFNFVFLAFLAVNIFAQTKKAEKISEFPTMSCEELTGRLEVFADLLNKNSEAKLYIIFYEGKHPWEIYNKRKKKFETKLVNPRHNQALNKTKAITRYLTKWRKFSKERFELVNGGFDSEYRVEVWLVPSVATPPKPTPTLKKKDIKFRKGKAQEVGDCQADYS